ncbi:MULTISPECIES: class I SAM-dependent DNA methyltransferase [unclassified Imperialibacter]|uniref:HsdM family class I SAM-dependent methyltransferase n=1 Tax=unclassified Imperialibacter TaxID=2629706 RepID=UPI001256C6C4|nr:MULTISPECIES: N-6 DNA methylase [unclassified Imperialibacter]CAD5248158.1 hypothetical protein IMPERIA75_10238 [Imperialibacter sp. 75]CAD5248280.1 hypothetical protein IMPERIA89_10239 [Imperialibacter sp. 89]VVS97528.1 hypothetical protein IMPR6_10239 [Imperialibacter sp. EC-SDR9]
MTFRGSFDHLLKTTADLLRSAGAREESYAEFFLTMLCLKFAPKFNLIQDSFLEPPFDRNISQREHIANSINGLTEIHPGLSVVFEDGRGLKEIDDELLNRILFIWNHFFEQNDRGLNWSPATVDLCFEAITEILIRNTRLPHLISTPVEIVYLMRSLIDIEGKHSIYDPYCRSGQFLNSAIDSLGEGANGAGEARDNLSLKISKARNFLLAHDNISIEFRSPDEIQQRSENFDIILTNPPFGVFANQRKADLRHFSAKFKTNRLEVSYLTHVLDHLSESGQAGIIVPDGLLTNAAIVQELRKEIVERNMLDAVVHLPARIFYETGVSCSILLLNRKRAFENVLLIDLSSDGVKERDRHVLPDAIVRTAVSSVKEFRKSRGASKGEQHSICVSPSEFASNDYSFRFARYQPQLLQLDNTSISSEKLWKECIEIEAKLISIRNEYKSII